MIATAGPADEVLTPLMRFWVRSIDVLVVEAPQFEVAKTVIRVRWLFSEELYLIHSLRVYDVANASRLSTSLREVEGVDAGRR
jgi:hypothetical protein